MLPRWLVKAMSVVIIAAWSVNLVMGWFFDRGIDSVNIVFGLMAGSVYVVSKKDKKDKEGE